MSSRHSIEVVVVNGNALVHPSDVLVLKYAQEHYGVDREAARLFETSGRQLRLPRPNEFTLSDCPDTVGPPQLLMVGTASLENLNYADIRRFSCIAFEAIAGSAVFVREISMTLHGPGFGLDEREAFESQLRGILDAVTAGDLPDSLETISFVERNPGRAQRMRSWLDLAIPSRRIETMGLSTSPRHSDQENILRSAGGVELKPHIFVAMPFANIMDDVFHYGIQGAVNNAGYLCERIDQQAFTGDILKRIQFRIAAAKLVIADMTLSNPNVYLEVGYAWGCGVRTLLIAQDLSELKFDVKGQRCIEYKTIKDLEIKLSSELELINC